MPAYQDGTTRKHSLFTVTALHSEQNILNVELNGHLLYRKSKELKVEDAT